MLCMYGGADRVIGDQSLAHLAENTWDSADK